VEGVTIRHAEGSDAEAFHRIMTAPRVVAGTLQLPYQSVERKKNKLAELPEGEYMLVAIVDGEVIGNLDLITKPGNPRTRHVGHLVMAVRDDWQGKGIGTALMEAALDLADNWLNLIRIVLHVYTDNTAGMSFRSSEISPGSAGSSKSSQSTPLTSGVPSSPTTTRSLSIL
jgi:putative acetyltransferase